MLKRCMTLLLLLVLALPLTALSANWTLTTRVATQGGSLTVDGGPAQSYGGTKTLSLPQPMTEVPVVVTADPGYQIAAIIINGKRETDLGGTYTMGSTYPTKTRQLVYAYFTPVKYKVSVTAGAGGSAGPTGVYSLSYNATKDFIFSPHSGNGVIDIENLNGQTYILTNYATGAAVTLPAATDVYVKVHLTATSDVTLNGVFLGMTADAGADQTVLVNSPVNLSATAVPPAGDTVASYAWTQVFGPAIALTGADTATPSFISGDVAANAIFDVTVTSTSGLTASDTVYVYVTTDAISAAYAQCQVCHEQNGVGAQNDVYNKWSTSTHQANTIMCYACHAGANSGAHPGTTPSSNTCQDCHGENHGPEYPDCLTCHDPHSAATFGAGGGCNFCHDYPPATGAHEVHFGLSETSGSYADLDTLETRYPTATIDTAPTVYAFGCANCHSVDSTNHKNGQVDFILYEASAEPGSIKSKNDPSAAYDPFVGTCSGIYCHSTGQEAPVYQVTPEWAPVEPPAEALGCDGCHGNPPAYPSGGEGTPTANNHVQIAADGWEWGHFQSTPGPWHSAYHGTQSIGGAYDASPLTCQSCHYETVDPANTGVSGFYYLDTSGFYVLEGSFSEDWYKERVLNCAYCHDPLNPNGVVNPQPAGTGQVLPLRHVNGKRDVVFDSRTELPQDIAWLPAEPNKPTRPFWSSRYAKQSNYPEIEVWDNGTTVSWDLSDATYDPETKTCSSTKCHVTDTAPVWGRPLGNGQFYGECCQCHADKCYY